MCLSFESKATGVFFARTGSDEVHHSMQALEPAILHCLGFARGRALKQRVWGPQGEVPWESKGFGGRQAHRVILPSKK